ncbi:MAG: class I SAM-dependent methyltransferase [Saprospiraceae bacterium]|nr:class I SAM-dependent methyltransferase [Saprospiraceae bacterium]MBL0098665.1 class I SAM-dependent methyltransferase [Saprospiraceae bacterium]
MRRIIFIYIVCASALIISCKGKDYTNVTPVMKESTPDTVHAAVGDLEIGRNNVGRAIWQKPNLVIEKLGDISDKVIADIGAGTGYFSFKLASKSKKVIAIEIEQGLLDFIDSTKIKLPADRRNHLETRLATPENPNLRDDEVDIILIINTVGYIPHLATYLQTIKKGLKKNGVLMIIDYKMKRLPINAPPKEERVYLDQLEDMLIKAGYKVFQTDDTSLDYQYIIQATKAY